MLDRADATGQGTVSVDLSTVLFETAALLQSDYGWAGFRKNSWLDTVPSRWSSAPRAER